MFEVQTHPSLETAHGAQAALYQRENAFLELCRHGTVPDVQLEIANGMDPRMVDDHPLLCAVAWNNLAVVQYLLALGADPNLSDGYLLIHAVHNRRVAMVALLLAHGADPRHRDYEAYRGIEDVPEMQALLAGAPIAHDFNVYF